MQLKVINLGSKVGVTDHRSNTLHFGTVNEIWIKGNPDRHYVEYEIIWWVGAERKKEWLTTKEFRLLDLKEIDELELELEFGFNK